MRGYQRSYGGGGGRDDYGGRNNRYGDRNGGGGGGYKRGGHHDRGSGRGERKYGLTDSNLKKPKWDMRKLTPFQKDFYQETPAVTSRSEAQVQEYYASKDITVTGRDSKIHDR